MHNKPELLGTEATAPGGSAFDHDARGQLTSGRVEIAFPGCERPTLGVELEVWLIDPETRALVPRAEEILARVGDDVRFKPELFQAIVELNTDICHQVGEVRRDLESRFATLRRVCDELGLTFMCTGTHPFAHWSEHPISTGERYTHLTDSMRWPARRMLICGSHVHVGVKSGEHAIALMNSLAVFLPHLLALSASSPYWGGFDTGMASSRIKVFEGLPTAGLPPRLTNWTQFVQLMRTLVGAGSISSIREIWWDIRPHPGFGTVELRMMDGLNTISEVCALAAFVQSLVSYLQEAYDNGEPLPVFQNWTLRENKWRAARYGILARLIRNERGTQVPLAEHVREWIERLGPTARRLGCFDELLQIETMLQHGPSYERQRTLCEAHGSLEGVVDGMVDELATDRPYGV